MINKVAVIGSRSITCKDFVFKTLDYYLQNLKGEIVIISGGAKGVDLLSELYAAEKGHKTEIYLPDYNTYSGKVAPLKRNQQIVNACDMLIAITTGSNGTAYTIKLAEKQNKPVRIITI